MSSLSRLLSGRRRESSVWNYFEYNENQNKSRCLAIVDVRSGKQCETVLNGKNSSNLVTHLTRFHKNEYQNYLASEKERERAKRGNKRTSESTGSLQNTSSPPFKQPTLQTCLNRTNANGLKWSRSSAEYKQRVDAVINMVIDTACPASIISHPSFLKMVRALDPKFIPPGRGGFNKLLKERYSSANFKLLRMIDAGRKYVICLDGWTKKGMSASFLGISACFFNTETNRPVHATLNLYQIHHPHTGAMICEALEKSLEEWDIHPQQILLIITDNGSNMKKCVGLLQEKYKNRLIESQEGDDETNVYHESDTQNDEQLNLSDSGDTYDKIDDDTDRIDDSTYEFDDCEIYDADDNTDDSDDEDEDLVLPQNILCRRMPCMAHTLQLVIKPVYKHYNSILSKVRNLVARIRKSSVAVEKLIMRCGKSVISDCTTRWNSTHSMISRLLIIKVDVNAVLLEIGMDSLLTSEWQKLEEIQRLLKPFAELTNILQTNSSSLSSILPSILNLECHLEVYQENTVLALAVMKDIRRRFESILCPDSPDFNPLPAAACLLDHRYCKFMLTPDMKTLLNAAKLYVVSLAGEVPCSIERREKEDETPCQGLDQFAFLVAKIKSNAANEAIMRSETPDTVIGQLNRFINDVKDQKESDIFQFWRDRQNLYPQLIAVAQDLLSAPASQAFVERIFSVCGILTASRRNRMSSNLEMRVFLKLNSFLNDE